MSTTPIMTTTAAAITAPLHPFYPQSILLSGGKYVPNHWNVSTLILAFAAGWVLILGVTFLSVRRVSPDLKSVDQALVLWFVLTGAIHCFFEGYFVYNHSRMSSRQDFFGQLWKEYALSDSRYMSSDPLVLCMESWTVIIWGPLSLLTAVLITTNSPFRHPIQALVSTGQFYGNLLYYTTSLFENFSSEKMYYRPEPYYFWVYFIFMNAIWLVIPGLCLYSSIKTAAKAFKVSSTLNMNGRAKKKL